VNKIIVVFLILTVSIRAQDSISVKVIARPLPEKTLLRWAVNEPYAWKKANEHGFLVERATISRNGEAVVPIERKMIVSNPLRPKPLEEWETLANKDQNFAVMAQALFGETFQVTTPGSAMGQVFAVNEELEQRFTIALIAAEQNFEAAKMAGWGYEDNTISPNEKYIYTISVATPEESVIKIEKGTVFASADLYEELPKPIGLIGAFGDGHVLLSWNFNLLQNLYSSYSVERSANNSTYKQLNGLPVFNAEQPKETGELSMFYTDSIANGIPYYYRIKGKTAFGEIGPVSEPLMGQAEQKLGFVPRIYKKEIPTDSKAILYWEFDEKGDELISGFELKRSNNDQGPFETVKSDIPISVRKVEFDGLKRINYFTIVAKGKNGLDSESFSTMVQPIDSIPPKPPMGLKGIMDTTGIIRLNWQKNVEEDLSGYRIFKSNNPNIEFSEITKTTFSNESYSDTIPVSTLNKKVYYKIKAEDLRYNKSEFSEILIVDIPDLIPPSPPVLKNYEVISEGIRINWIPSSSLDVSSHSLYRKSGNQETKWELLKEFASLLDTTFLDSKDLGPNSYNYTIIAKDTSGLESAPANPITINWLGKTLEEKDIKFSGTVNRELRFINLSWRIKEEIREYRLYRGNNESNLRLYKTLDGNSKSYNDVSLEINSNYTYGLQALMANGRTSVIKKINLKY